MKVQFKKSYLICSVVVEKALWTLKRYIFGLERVLYNYSALLLLITFGFRKFFEKFIIIFSFAIFTKIIQDIKI